MSARMGSLCCDLAIWLWDRVPPRDYDYATCRPRRFWPRLLDRMASAAYDLGTRLQGWRV